MTFTAVHDSYWTHACDVDEMNEKLRDAFVELHEQPLLEELRTCLALQYPGLDIPPVPARGNLDLNDVRDSEYFFN
jgi:DNA-directed RNA polymerase